MKGKLKLQCKIYIQQGAKKIKRAHKENILMYCLREENNIFGGEAERETNLDPLKKYCIGEMLLYS
jgi:hypothetical protein